MQFISIRIPIIDTGEDEPARIRKMHEEIDELLDEVCVGPIDKKSTMAEFFDVCQVMHGYIQAGAKQLLVGEDARLYVEEYFRQRNDEHIEKMRQRAAERGWTI